jgi:4-diphosphocytidyl-2C-methyl-D-erythritol kinase
MTGSGSAVFGIYEDAEAAKKAFDGIDPSKAKKFISFFRCP